MTIVQSDNSRNAPRSATSEKRPYAPVSSESSLDSFIMGLPGADELPKFQSPKSSDKGRRPLRNEQAGGEMKKKLPSFTRPSHTHFMTPPSQSIPDFLFSLTKMLADENSDIIEWNNGRIEVHSPKRLETEVLHKYFRHSKFASLQRQLNYFGFRKIAGKGKMAPCSYVNEAAKGDLASLIFIKRKGSVSGLGPVEKQRNIKPSVPNRSTTTTASQHELAQSAAGRGIRHDLRGTQVEARQVSLPRTEDMSAMVDEADHTLHEETSDSRPTYSLLPQNSSLIDLAMIPDVKDSESSTDFGLAFVDFPNQIHNNDDDAYGELEGPLTF